MSHEHFYDTSVINLRELKEKAGHLVSIASLLDLDAYDVYTAMFDDLSASAERALSGKLCGVHPSYCYGLDAETREESELVSGTLLPFLGRFCATESFVAPIVPLLGDREMVKDVAVPALIFEPVDTEDMNEELVETYTTGAYFFGALAVPLIGPRLSIRKVGAIQEAA